MLKIENLQVEIDGQEIVKGLDLEVDKGEIHAIMGPNGSGKSTLANVLMGHPRYEVTGGSITFQGEDVFELEPDERARLSVPVEPDPASGECRVVYTVERTAIPEEVTGGGNPDPRVLGAHFDRLVYRAG